MHTPSKNNHQVRAGGVCLAPLVFLSDLSPSVVTLVTLYWELRGSSALPSLSCCGSRAETSAGTHNQQTRFESSTSSELFAVNPRPVAQPPQHSGEPQL